MTHINFDSDNMDWSSFINRQEGGGEQSKFFVGTKFQRGFGVLHNIARFLLPVAKNLAYSAGAEGITSGTKVLQDLSEGKDFKESITERGRESLAKLGEKLQQCGKGKKRNRKLKAIKVENGIPVIPNIPKRRRKPDQFDQL